jgi:hypothetical protein
MQIEGDLENSWMMFNDVKRVQGWTTMAYHVHDHVYCKIMSIAICDMQLEDTEAQCILWKKLNAIVLKKGVRNPNFKGFMADITQANWNDVCIVYGTRDPIVKLIDKECTYFFHWTQSLDMHTKQFIALKFQDQHTTFCYNYKKAKSLEGANSIMLQSTLGGIHLGLIPMV